MDDDDDGGLGVHLSSTVVSVPSFPSVYRRPSTVVEEMSPSEVLLVFVLTCIGQGLMSYDGGASSMSTAALLEIGWSSSEIGLLCAMDKFGQVPMSLACGYFLTKYSNKFMVAVALLLKALSCLGFGVLHDHLLMLMTKFSMGASEAVVGIWGIVWIQGHAPEESAAMWLGLQGVSAGIGSGVGSVVAGLCSEQMGYAFAFVLQSICLFTVWAVIVALPESHFDMGVGSDVAGELILDNDEREALTSPDVAQSVVHQRSQSLPARSPARGGNQAVLKRSASLAGDVKFALHLESARSLSVDEAALETFDTPAFACKETSQQDIWSMYKGVLMNPLWLWTAVASSLSVFMQTGINYLWQNTVLNVWRFTSAQVTISLILVTGVGGGIGNKVGPDYFDRTLGGFATAAGKVLCLRWCCRFAFVAAVLASSSSALFWKTAYSLLHYQVEHQPQGGQLLFVLFSIAAIFGILMSMNGTLIGINTESVSVEKRATAAGLTVAVANIVGYAFGSLVPMAAADVAGGTISYQYPEEHERVVRSAQFAIGMSVALLSGWLLLWFLFFAQRAARKVAMEAC